VNPRQISVRDAFDRHAETYDERFSNHELGETIRSDVWKITDPIFASARNLLDLGSGTGEDALHYAARDMRVTAVDISDQMLGRLKSKAIDAGVAAKLQYVRSEMNQYRPEHMQFDAVISNFGAVNCLLDLNWIPDLCRVALKPGAPLVLTGMGVFYPFESAALFLSGHFGSVFRRLQRPCTVSVEGVSIPVYYHTLRSMRRMLGKQFHLECVEGLRAFLPVPGWDHVSHAKVLQWLDPLDRLWCRFRWTAPLADHFVTVWRYRP
jgi:ubiquinone/menaquinone biosynthesis C-methylase UbiE